MVAGGDKSVLDRTEATWEVHGPLRGVSWACRSVGQRVEQSDQERVGWALGKAKRLRPCEIGSLTGCALGKLTCCCSLQGFPMQDMET